MNIAFQNIDSDSNLLYWYIVYIDAILGKLNLKMPTKYICFVIDYNYYLIIKTFQSSWKKGVFKIQYKISLTMYLVLNSTQIHLYY